ncbi:MAG TPA: glutathione peroxidase [Chitinophagaceae bacterium]|nr:glutathione peroxidase [Chitinophagaceae bacterium]
MLKCIPIVLLTLSCTAGNNNADQQNKNTPMISTSAEITDSTKNIYQFKVAALDGGTIDFASFKGKKILVVNTASECGYTPQYKDLEALYQRYKEKLVIVGFPANNFGGQEPGSNEEIKSFCQKNYGVSFPMAAKVSVKGDDMSPIYQWLTNKNQNHVMDAEVKWNFNKFLIDEQGRLLTKFDSRVTPLSDEITSML